MYMSIHSYPRLTLLFTQDGSASRPSLKSAFWGSILSLLKIFRPPPRLLFLELCPPQCLSEAIRELSNILSLRPLQTSGTAVKSQELKPWWLRWGDPSLPLPSSLLRCPRGALSSFLVSYMSWYTRIHETWHTFLKRPPVSGLSGPR